MVRLGERKAVFQAVSEYPASIYRTNPAFHDLAALDDPPSLIAIVRDKAALGSRFALLAQTAHVIEQDQSDEIFLRSAA